MPRLHFIEDKFLMYSTFNFAFGASHHDSSGQLGDQSRAHLEELHRLVAAHLLKTSNCKHKRYQ